jgi:sugar diacid utilization regulator
MVALCAEMHLHVNTVRYRIERIEALTGATCAASRTRPTCCSRLSAS